MPTRNSDVDLLLSKPFDVDELRQAIEVLAKEASVTFARTVQRLRARDGGTAVTSRVARHARLLDVRMRCLIMESIMGNPLKILAVDDEPSIAQSMRFIFDRPHYELSSAQDGETALARLTAEPDSFDVIITDNNMPGVSGMEFVRQLRKRSFAGKIMVLSAHLSTDVRAAYEAMAVDAMIDKPFSVQALRKALDQACGLGLDAHSRESKRQSLVEIHSHSRLPSGRAVPRRTLRAAMTSAITFSNGRSSSAAPRTMSSRLTARANALSFIFFFTAATSTS